MFAIIRSGGKQYKVQPGDVIRVGKLENELGSEFVSNEVLMVGGETSEVGVPLVKNATVTLVVTKQTKDRKVIVFKKKRRQGYRKFATHRQHFTELFVKSISLGSKTANAEEKPEVINVDQKRNDKIAERTVTKKQALEDARAAGTPKAAKKAPVKKAAKKPAAKKAGAAKKKTAAKKSVKKVAKKSKK